MGTSQSPFPVGRGGGVLAGTLLGFISNPSLAGAFDGGVCRSVRWLGKFGVHGLQMSVLRLQMNFGKAKGASGATHPTLESPHLSGVMNATSVPFAGMSLASQILQENSSTAMQSLLGAWSVLSMWVEQLQSKVYRLPSHKRWHLESCLA